MWHLMAAVISVLLVAPESKLPKPAKKVEELNRLALISKANPEVEKLLEKAEIVFTATLAKATEGAIAKSLPPIRYYTLEFTNVKMIKGQVPAETKWNYGVRSMEAPEFDAATYAVAARLVDGEFRLELLLPALRIPKDANDTVRRKLEDALREQSRPIDPRPR